MGKTPVHGTNFRSILHHYEPHHPVMEKDKNKSVKETINNPKKWHNRTTTVIELSTKFVIK
jgi:hypothetical protein